ncbi:hypothetical protein [Staphylococcus caprae]|uniref:hypothetical protein n=1 Tax=Staphylococcus caprae TaxID=29380 RepID=UPI001E556426|nr:hypothetical protein [Staphylococcus caprae]MDI0014807.1 hypothetical protein [Staphylococcus caprae]MDK6298233.1 hypothetical protein [Staphylococcus caprae]MDK7232311.1 hypothetical protein [Staphylococcus caprae]MEB8094801.1 hypothetical protein [Staphylococcus caprae]
MLSLINYIKSENYRILHSKGFYIYTIICNLLIILAAITLMYFDKTTNKFPYGNAKFFYSNVISAGLIIIVIGIAFNLLVNNKESQRLVKDSISFDISLYIIFIGKFLIYICYFFIMCLISLISTIVLGLTIFNTDIQSLNQFLISLLNMAPIIFGGLALGHTLNSFKINGAIVVIFTSILYYYSSTLFKLLTLLSNKFEPLYKNSPTNLFYTNLNKYLDTSNQFAYQNWIIGIILGTIFLVIGCLIFSKKEFK